MIYTNNWMAIVVAVVATFVLGWLWYGPIFGKMWMRWQGMTPEKMGEMKKSGSPTRGYIVSLIASILTPFVYFSIAQNLLVSSYWDAGWLAFWLWAGFTLPLSLGSVLWEGKSWKLFFLNSLYWLASFKLIALIYIWMVA